MSGNNHQSHRIQEKREHDQQNSRDTKHSFPGRTSPECSHSSSSLRIQTGSPCPLFPPHNARTCHTDQRRVNPDLVSTRPFMLELSYLQTHRPPIPSQPARLASIPLRNTTRLRHLLPTHPSTPHLDTFNTHPTPHLPTTIHPLRTPRNTL